MKGRNVAKKEGSVSNGKVEEVQSMELTNVAKK
jgi:hypothetical protein